MDGRRFDRLTVLLASGVSRRSTLRGLVGGLLAGAAATARPGQLAAACPPGGKPECNDDRRDCRERCRQRFGRDGKNERQQCLRACERERDDCRRDCDGGGTCVADGGVCTPDDPRATPCCNTDGTEFFSCRAELGGTGRTICCANQQCPASCLRQDGGSGPCPGCCSGVCGGTSCVD